jgi:hypothetical protein
MWLPVPLGIIASPEVHGTTTSIFQVAIKVGYALTLPLRCEKLWDCNFIHLDIALAANHANISHKRSTVWSFPLPEFEFCEHAYETSAGPIVISSSFLVWLLRPYCPTLGQRS